MTNYRVPDFVGVDEQKKALIYASVWPDTLRDKSLKQLFVLYGSGKTPKKLSRYRTRNTRAWHYSNVRFISSGKQVFAAHEKFDQCRMKISGELLRVWPLLVDSYRQASDARDKAILLSFLIHLTADAYQPLHLLTAVDSSCRHDRGGNGYCLGAKSSKKSKKRKCEYSLHRLWDGGFEVFDGGLISPAGGRSESPVADLSLALEKLEPYWLSVYPNRAEDVDKKEYQHRSKKIVTFSSQSASAHLASLLVDLF